MTLTSRYLESMANVLLFHHALGVTEGVRGFADAIRGAGHHVVVPDLFDGKTFDTIDAGVAHVDPRFDDIVARAVECAVGLGDGLVVAGFSLGSVPAQKLAQTRPGVAAAILYDGANPVSAFGEKWPAAVGIQIHVAEDDDWVDVDIAQELAATAGGELFSYPVSTHLVADSTVPGYSPRIAAQILERTLVFLDAL